MSDNTADPIGPEVQFKQNLLLQWFVFPMLVVVLSVGLYLSFRFLTAEDKSTDHYLNDLRSGNPHRAWQAAFSLANQVNLDRLTESEKPAVGRNILQMLTESSPGAGQIRQYFILTLGRLRYRDAIPKLTDVARGSDASEKIYALLALREMRAVEALPAVTEALQDPDPGVRKSAAYFFGGMRAADPALPPAALLELHPLLHDPVADVRWNAALSLAEFGDPKAVAVLMTLLDRVGLSAEMKKTAVLDETNVEKIMKAALAASVEFQDPALIGAVERLVAKDPQVSIRTAAKLSLDQMRGNK